jgi:uncharacterized protein (TIGR02598 family)
MKSFAHPTSAKFAKDFSYQKNNSFRLYPDWVGAWRPLREPSPTLHAKYAKAATNNNFPSFPSSQNQISNIKNQKSFLPRSWRPLRESSAFSLTEVVIAMGVAAVAFTSIIALFPLGLNMSRESYEETESALIAHTILADLKDEAGGSGTWSTKRLIQTNANSSPAISGNYFPVEFNTNLTTPQIIYVAYNQVARANSDTDPTGQPIMLRPFRGSTNSNDFYIKGTNGAAAVVKITINKTFCVNGATTSGDPRRVDVSVETPGSSPSTNRTTFLYTGIVPPG